MASGRHSPIVPIKNRDRVWAASRFSRLFPPAWSGLSFGPAWRMKKPFRLSINQIASAKTACIQGKDQVNSNVV
jgi:hypothetical protein